MGEKKSKPEYKNKRWFTKKEKSEHRISQTKPEMIVIELCLRLQGITDSFYHIYCKTDLNLSGEKEEY